MGRPTAATSTAAAGRADRRRHHTWPASERVARAGLATLCPRALACDPASVAPCACHALPDYPKPPVLYDDEDDAPRHRGISAAPMRVRCARLPRRRCGYTWRRVSDALKRGTIEAAGLTGLTWRGQRLGQCEGPNERREFAQRGRSRCWRRP